MSFQTAIYCEMYPVTNYTLKIKQLSTGSDIQELTYVSATNCVIANNLLENVIYLFRITAWNSAGSASSDSVEVCKLAANFTFQNTREPCSPEVVVHVAQTN